MRQKTVKSSPAYFACTSLPSRSRKHDVLNHRSVDLYSGWILSAGWTSRFFEIVRPAVHSKVPANDRRAASLALLCKGARKSGPGQLE
jgi:hypothetical protein